MLTVIMGPMGGGKSTELLRRERRACIARLKCVCLKYSGDTRYDGEKIATHDGVRGLTASIPVNDLSAVTLPPHTDLVLIDEAQFIKNVAETCARWLSDGDAKEIVIAMLNADYQSKPFDNTAEIVARADNIIFLSAVCAKCAADASRTCRLTQESTRELIGGFDVYSPRCSVCART
jgi:thymidine kinase